MDKGMYSSKPSPFHPSSSNAPEPLTMTSSESASDISSCAQTTSLLPLCRNGDFSLELSKLILLPIGRSLTAATDMNGTMVEVTPLALLMVKLRVCGEESRIVPHIKGILRCVSYAPSKARGITHTRVKKAAIISLRIVLMPPCGMRSSFPPSSSSCGTSSLGGSANRFNSTGQAYGVSQTNE